MMKTFSFLGVLAILASFGNAELIPIDRSLLAAKRPANAQSRKTMTTATTYHAPRLGQTISKSNFRKLMERNLQDDFPSCFEDEFLDQCGDDDELFRGSCPGLFERSGNWCYFGFGGLFDGLVGDDDILAGDDDDGLLSSNELVCCGSDSFDCCSPTGGGYVVFIAVPLLILALVILASCACCKCCPWYSSLCCSPKTNTMETDVKPVAQETAKPQIHDDQEAYGHADDQIIVGNSVVSRGDHGSLHM